MTDAAVGTVAMDPRGYLWSAVIGEGRGELFLALAEDVGFGRGGGAVGKC